jgi:hypothetical protein
LSHFLFSESLTFRVDFGAAKMFVEPLSQLLTEGSARLDHQLEVWHLTEYRTLIAAGFGLLFLLPLIFYLVSIS